MANICTFTMKIVGKKENVEEFTRRMQREGEFKDSGIGRVYDFDTTEPDHLSDGTIMVLGSGDCAWSLWCACMKEYRGDQPSLESEAERLDLVLEVYTEEPGCCFQEHYFIVKGDILTDECVEYHEFWKDGYDEDVWKEILEKNGLSEYDLNDDGFIPVGGFDDYCDFTKMDEYLKNIAVEVIESEENKKSVIEKGQRWMITLK